MRALTFALTQPETAQVALAALASSSATEVVEALVVEVLARPHVSPATPRALALLAECDHPLLVDDALIGALDSPLVTVRLPAVEALARRGVSRAAGRLLRMLREDDTWMVRRGVVRALAGHPEPARWLLLAAADDPHWRVRHALIGALLPLGQTPEMQQAIDRRLAELPAQPRIEGVRGYLQARWTGSTDVAGVEEQAPTWPFHDPDPAVVVRNLEELGESGRRRHLDLLPALLSHEADRARSLAIEALRRHGGTVHLALAVGQLEDPRTGAGAAVEQLLRNIDLDRIEETARYLLHKDDPSPAQLAWAIDQAGPVYPPEEEREVLLRCVEAFARQPPRVQIALARLAGYWPDKEADPWLLAFLAAEDNQVQMAALGALVQRGVPLPVARASELLASAEPEVRKATVMALAKGSETAGLLERAATDVDSRVRIAVAERLVGLPGNTALSAVQQDVHPLVRAAALTAERAAELIAQPERETSWHVLECAARMRNVPFWRLEPQPPWLPSPSVAAAVVEPLPVHLAAPPHARPLGPRKLLVPPVGISGHYGLPVEGFVKAVESGVNLLFWEPNYQTLTSFAGRLSPAQRGELHFLAGTFEASASRIRKDVQRVLRNLQIERIGLFLVFWTRTWERITDEVRHALEQMQREGLLGMAGLSTHSRALAVEAMAAGWNPVMVRHSAAHRGAETQVFPHVPQGTSIITFNNTCYGRLLKPQGERPVPPAADCYRYTLSFPQVTMCLSAPATLEQLEANLQSLRDPDLPEERRQLLLEQGADVYREETLFRRLVRSR
jgi:aryl-alcohol dehydrogenase-like predicted oxidoreductase/HEAT repeat protein